MRTFFALVTCLGMATTLIAQEGMFCESSLEIHGGWRSDEIDFRFGSHFDTANDAIKASFKDYHSYLIGATVRALSDCGVALKISADYGQFYDGTSKVAELDCTSCKEIVRNFFKFDSKKGEVWDLSGAVGYTWGFCSDTFRLTPLVGFSHHEQHFKRFGPLHRFFNDGLFPTQECSESCPYTSPPSCSSSDDGTCLTIDNDCFTSNYRSRWRSPWAGLELQWQPCWWLDLYGVGEWHYAWYKGRGRWEFRDRFVDDFEQRATGYGQVYAAGARFSFNPCWSLGVEGKYQKWETRHGRDRSYLKFNPCETQTSSPPIVDLAVAKQSNPSSIADNDPCIGEQNTLDSRLKKVDWESYSIVGTLTYHF